jgi:hypothetical protein
MAACDGQAQPESRLHFAPGGGTSAEGGQVDVGACCTTFIQCAVEAGVDSALAEQECQVLVNQLADPALTAICTCREQAACATIQACDLCSSQTPPEGCPSSQQVPGARCRARSGGRAL